MNYKDSDILFDDINHLTVYVKNIYKFDLDAAIEGKQTQVATPSVGEVQEPNQPKSFADILPAMFGAGSPDQFANLPPEQNPFYQQAANVRIQQEVKSGKLYLFKSKPPIMPFFKVVLSLCLFFISASAIVFAVGLILVANTQYFSGTNTIVHSVLVIVLATMSSYLGVMIGMPLIKRISKKPNDNQLYYLN
jgi:NADH:ubiquinone oxidoreductase subunit K